MNTRCLSSLMACALALAGMGLCSAGLAQNNGPSSSAGSTPVLQTLPRLIKFSGVLSPQIAEMAPANPADSGNALPSRVVAMAFALYESQQGGSPLWTETQNVEVDEHGRYTVLLGAASPDGLPLDLFANAKAHWLSTQPQLPGISEQPRVALVGVPYALKAADADTLGGKPASAYVTTNSNLNVSSATGEEQVSTASAAQATSGPAAVSGAPAAPRSAAQAALAVSGSGTTNDIPIWTSSTTLGNSALVQVGGKVGAGDGDSGHDAGCSQHGKPA